MKPAQEPVGARLLQVDRARSTTTCATGWKENWDEFFATLVRPLDGAAQRSPLIKNYLMMHIIAAGQFVHDLGGDSNQIVPDLGHD